MTKQLDQILFWDTASDGTVSLSSDEKYLRDKIIATHLLGGHIVVRPAELFEGEDFFYESAINPKGYFYRLMESGQASLALSGGMTLEERAAWRFREGHVFDRGQLITEHSQVEAIRQRTYHRVEQLNKVGWKPTPIQLYITNKDASILLNKRFRELLRLVGEKYFQSDLSNTPLGQFILEKNEVASRADLYPIIETKWTAPLDNFQRFEFSQACKDALTIATLANTATRYGGRVSELRPTTFKLFSLGAALSAGRVIDAEMQILRVFPIALPEKMSEAEKSQGKPFVTAVQTVSAARFVAATNENITSKDRYDLCDLLYGASKIEKLKGKSLVHFIATSDTQVTDEKAAQYIKERIEEMTKANNLEAWRLQKLLSTLRCVVGEAVLLLLGINIPGAFTVTESAYQLLKGQPVTEPPLFGGFRKPLTKPVV